MSRADLVEAELEETQKKLEAAEKKLKEVWEVFHILDSFIGSMPTCRQDLIGSDGYKKYKKLMGYADDDDDN